MQVKFLVLTVLIYSTPILGKDDVKVRVYQHPKSTQEDQLGPINGSSYPWKQYTMDYSSVESSFKEITAKLKSITGNLVNLCKENPQFSVKLQLGVESDGVISLVGVKGKGAIEMGVDCSKIKR